MNDLYNDNRVSERVDMNVLHLDMNNLIEQKNQEVKQIEKLQEKVEQMTERVTLGDVNSLYAFNPPEKYQ